MNQTLGVPSPCGAASAILDADACRWGGPHRSYGTVHYNQDLLAPEVLVLALVDCAFHGSRSHYPVARWRAARPNATRGNVINPSVVYRGTTLKLLSLPLQVLRDVTEVRSLQKSNYLFPSIFHRTKGRYRPCYIPRIS
jgi:hypothetical protein